MFWKDKCCAKPQSEDGEGRGACCGGWGSSVGKVPRAERLSEPISTDTDTKQTAHTC